jgi:hypothetical protein
MITASTAGFKVPRRDAYRQVAKRSKTYTFLNIVAPVTVDQNTLEPAATAASEPFASLLW